MCPSSSRYCDSYRSAYCARHSTSSATAGIVTRTAVCTVCVLCETVHHQPSAVIIACSVYNKNIYTSQFRKKTLLNSMKNFDHNIPEILAMSLTVTTTSIQLSRGLKQLFTAPWSGRVAYLLPGVVELLTCSLEW